VLRLHPVAISVLRETGAPVELPKVTDEGDAALRLTLLGFT
jgi:hypothetical protein